MSATERRTNAARRGCTVPFLVLALALPEAAWAAAPRLRLAESIDYSSGDYGQAEPTDIAAFTSTARVAWGPWAVRASAPYLRVTGPVADALLDDGLRPSATTGGARRTVSGLGDVGLAATRSFTLRPGRTTTYLDVTGRVKLPTGDEARGLGSGTLDGGLRAELGWAGPKAGGYASVGRRFLGDRTDLRRRDGWQAGGGVWWTLVDDVSAGAYYDWRRASIAGVADPKDVGGYVGWRFARAWRVDLSVSHGLSESSADYGLGLSVAWRPVPGRPTAPRLR